MKTRAFELPLDILPYLVVGLNESSSKTPRHKIPRVIVVECLLLVLACHLSSVFPPFAGPAPHDLLSHSHQPTSPALVWQLRLLSCAKRRGALDHNRTPVLRCTTGKVNCASKVLPSSQPIC